MKHDTDMGNDKSLSEYFAVSAQRIITVDVAKYEQYLDGSDLSDEQKEEFLQAIWMLVSTFAELGFGVHPLQEACGKNNESPEQRPKDAFDQVRSDELLQIEPKNRTGPHDRLEAE
jgi:uncharacterized protein YeaC (DUF1315 family)